MKEVEDIVSGKEWERLGPLQESFNRFESLSAKEHCSQRSSQAVKFDLPIGGSVAVGNGMGCQVQGFRSVPGNSMILYTFC